MKESLFSDIENVPVGLDNLYIHYDIKNIYRCICEIYHDNKNIKHKLMKISDNEYVIRNIKCEFNILKINIFNNEISLNFLIEYNNILNILDILYHKYGIDIHEIGISTRTLTCDYDIPISHYICEHMPKINTKDTRLPELYISQIYVQNMDDFVTMLKSIFDNNPRIQYVIIYSDRCLIGSLDSYNTLYSLVLNETVFEYKQPLSRITFFREDVSRYFKDKK